MASDGGAPPRGEPEQARIGIYLRLRPVPRPSGRVVANAEEGWVEFNVPRDATQGLINNSRESYRFPFDGLLPPDAAQDEVFDRVALPVLRCALDGYNGTVFAFGQTGSGKTFTITGGTERYADRGLIPRAISALFAEAARRTGHTYTLHVSYMEIYNEAGYDLLEPAREVKALEDLPRVHIQEDDENSMHLRNLSLHRCDTEEQALNMLFLGDTNRVVAETPLNQASSRSHCVFTLHVEVRRAGEAVVRRSKLHFVDLAGSERVSKTGLAAHAQLKEAKYINLSLHFLEQVIISLQEGRPHIPYRNSVLTQVLRDSLGGNTRTVMVAAVAPEAQHVEESISTCRFAQRVAMISNRVEVNEELDLELVIRRLRQENALLRQEVQLLRSTGSTGSSAAGRSNNETGGEAEGGAMSDGGSPEQRGELTEAERHLLRRQVQAFVEDPDPDALLNVEASMRVIRAAFDMLKGMARGGPGAGQQLSLAAGGASTDAAELRSLRLLVQQQEQQIGVLAGVLRKQSLGPGGSGAAHSRHSCVSSGSASETFQPAAMSSRPSSAGLATGSRLSSGQQPVGGGSASGSVRQMQAGGKPGMHVANDLLADQQKAFEHFCATSPAHDTVADHKAVLKGKYEEARALGSQVSASKARIGQLKAAVEQRRLARSMAALLRQQQAGSASSGDAGSEEAGQEQDAEEGRAKELIEKEKAAYREVYSQLRGLKAEIDGVQASLEHSRARLQHDFRAWYAAMTGSAVTAASGTGGSSGSGLEVSVLAAAAPQYSMRFPGPTDKQEQQEEGQDCAQHDWLIPAAGVRPGSSSGMSALSSGRQLELQAGAPSHPSVGPLPSFTSWRKEPAIAFDQQPPASHLEQRQVQQKQQSGQLATSSSLVLNPRRPIAGAAASMMGIAADASASQVVQHAEAQQQQQQPPGPAELAAAAPYAGVDPEVLAAARPLLTGNSVADGDIIQFYQARAALLRGMR